MGRTGDPALARRFGDLNSKMFEVHAGAAYCAAIEPEVFARDGRVETPLRGLPLGAQLGCYAARPRAPARTVARRRTSTAAEFQAAIRALDGAPFRISAHDWPGGLAHLDDAGLYSWWVDETGADELSEGLGHRVVAGRIYAGQTGATNGRPAQPAPPPSRAEPGATTFTAASADQRFA